MQKRNYHIVGEIFYSSVTKQLLKAVPYTNCAYCSVFNFRVCHLFSCMRAYSLSPKRLRNIIFENVNIEEN